jgi:SAM-dependent methyltransferase
VRISEVLAFIIRLLPTHGIELKLWKWELENQDIRLAYLLNSSVKFYYLRKTSLMYQIGVHLHRHQSDFCFSRLRTVNTRAPKSAFLEELLAGSGHRLHRRDGQQANYSLRSAVSSLFIVKLPFLSGQSDAGNCPDPGGYLKLMKVLRWASGIKKALARGVFPHEVSFFLELPWRNIMLSPQTLAARLSLTTTSQVLEVGAGSGFYSAEVARKVSEGHLELLDLQAEMLKKAQQKLEAKKLSNVGYTLAEAGLLPFKAESFDAIFLVAVLGEVRNQKAFLSEAHRVLKPKGILSISEHLPDPDFLSLARVKLLVEKEGFGLFQSYGVKWSYTVNFRKSEATP